MINGLDNAFVSIDMLIISLILGSLLVRTVYMKAKEILSNRSIKK